VLNDDGKENGKNEPAVDGKEGLERIS